MTFTITWPKQRKQTAAHIVRRFYDNKVSYRFEIDVEFFPLKLSNKLFTRLFPVYYATRDGPRLILIFFSTGTQCYDIYHAKERCCREFRCCYRMVIKEKKKIERLITALFFRILFRIIKSCSLYGEMIKTNIFLRLFVKIYKSGIFPSHFSDGSKKKKKEINIGRFFSNIFSRHGEIVGFIVDVNIIESRKKRART